MFSRVWRFQDSAIPVLYSKRSRGKVPGPMLRHPVATTRPSAARSVESFRMAIVVHLILSCESVRLIPIRLRGHEGNVCRQLHPQSEIEPIFQLGKP